MLPYNNTPNQNSKADFTPEALPQLRGLKGGDKQEWINAHLDTIATVQDLIGFDDACKLFNMKAETMVKALRRSEEHHRPEVRKSEIALNRADAASNKADDALNEINQVSEVLRAHISADAERTDQLIQYFKIQAATNTMMADLLSKQAQSRNFTEHIGSPNPRKVSLTTLRKSKKTVRTHSAGRLSVSLPVRLQLTGAKGNLHRHSRHFRTKGRWPDV